MRRVLLLVLVLPVLLGGPLALAAPGRPAPPRPPRPGTYLVGGGARSINPTPAMLAARDFYLGGYGFGDYKVANQVQVPGTAGRSATGVLGEGVSSRALAVSDRRATIVLAQVETQGYFAAYKQGPFGLTAIRQDAAAAIARLAATPGRRAPAPTAAQILVDSAHSHGGPDTVGVWGGVPTAYLRLVRDRTVAAIVAAWQALRPATLTYGVAHAGVAGQADYPPSGGSDPLLTNQFRNDPRNAVMDDEVRVLQARDPRTGAVLDTYVNFSAHPTVLDGDNTQVTGDYVGRLNGLLERTYGGFAFDQVGTLGRTQPNRTDCPDRAGPDADPAVALCKLDAYAARVLVKVRAALAAASPLTGRPAVALNSYLLTDPATSPVLGAGVYAGTAVGAPIARAANPPWFTGTLIGTTAFSGRIGDLLISGGPGEMYPQIPDMVRRTVTGMRGYLSVGTAGDFLGYLIAPLEAYPEPLRRSALSGAPPPGGDSCSGVPSPVGCPDPVGNDNYLFNVSHTLGERLTCGLLRGAGDVLAGEARTYWSRYPRCAAFANDLALAAGADTTFPQQPDLSAAMPHL